jgi:DNA-binding IclR family transcriptional regulator
VPALERALAILEMIAQSRSGLTLSQITRGLELPKSSIYCLLLTFERLGYLDRSETSGRYVCGAKLGSIARTAIEGFVLREKAAPLLRELGQRIGLTVHMAILRSSQATIIAKITPQTGARMASWVGKRVDVHCTSLGKCLIAYLSDEELKSVIRGHGLLRNNENTIVSLSRLKREIAQTRQSGYSIDDEEEEIGMRCIGVPVFDAEGRVAAALSMSGTTAQIDLARCKELAAALKSTATALSRIVGGTGEPRTRAAAASVFTATG